MIMVANGEGHASVTDSDVPSKYDHQTQYYTAANSDTQVTRVWQTRTALRLVKLELVTGTCRAQWQLEHCLSPGPLRVCWSLAVVLHFHWQFQWQPQPEAVQVPTLNALPVALACTAASQASQPESQAQAQLSLRLIRPG
jgi:hypothetical protein